MQKTTLYLDAAEYRRLKAIAAERGATPAALVREAVAEYNRNHRRKSRPRSLGVARSGRKNLGDRSEELLRGFGRKP